MRDFNLVDSSKKLDKEQIRESLTYWKDAWRRLKGNVVAMIGLVGVILNLIQQLNPEISVGFSTVLIQFVSPIFLWFGAAFIASRVASKIPEILDKLIVKVHYCCLQL